MDDGEAFDDLDDTLERLEEARAAAEADDSVDNRMALATALLEAAQYLMAEAQSEDARVLLAEALPLTRELGEQLAGDRMATTALAIALNLAGSLHVDEDEPEAAIPLLDEASALQSELLKVDRSEETLLLCAMAASFRADMHQALEEDAKALRDCEEAVEWRREILKKFGIDETRLHAFAQALEALAAGAAKADKVRTSVQGYREAIRVRRAILADFEKSAMNYDLLARVLADLADLLVTVDEGAARKCCAEALDALEQGLHTEDEMDRDALLQSKAEVLEILYNVLEEDGEAREALEAAVAIYRQLLETYPENDDIREALVETLGTMKEYHKSEGNAAAAREIGKELKRLEER